MRCIYCPQSKFNSLDSHTREDTVFHVVSTRVRVGVGNFRNSRLGSCTALKACQWSYKRLVLSVI